MSLLRPPIVRSATAALDRALFTKTFPISAVRISNIKNISKIKTGLEQSREILKLERLTNVRPDPSSSAKGAKCLLLRPEVKPGGML